VVAGIASLLGYLVATGTITPGALVLVLIVTLITAAGNVVNDYCDRDIDIINRPERPIPSGSVPPRAAPVYAALLFIIGILASLAASPLCLVIAIFNSLLLVVYAARLKGMPLVGNIAVSYLASSIFLFGGALSGMDGLLQNLPLVGITFLAMLSRELLKDAEDVEGDKEGGAETLPILIGVRKTCILAAVLAAGAVAMSYLPLLRWWGVPYILAITLADIMILAGGVRGAHCITPECVQHSGATKILKSGMFTALLIFMIFAITL